MNPLVLALQLWSTLKSVPWLYRLVKNWRDVKQVLITVRNVVESARVSGGLPTETALIELVQSVRVLFEKEIVDFPDLDEAAFSEMLREIEGNLVTVVDQGRRIALSKRQNIERV